MIVMCWSPPTSSELSDPQIVRLSERSSRPTPPPGAASGRRRPVGVARSVVVAGPREAVRTWPMSMKGKVVVVTGSNVGIGLETAVGVAAREATTVLACRNQAKAEAAAKEVTRRTWNDDVHVVPLDLADLASVRKAADEILTRWNSLDVLVNNAGGTW